VNFNSKITDERTPPVRRRAPHWARAVARRCRVAATHRAVARGLKLLSGQRAARPDRPPRLTPDSAPPRTRRRHPDCLADRAAVPTDATSPGPPPRPPRRSPVAVVPRRRPRAGEPPIPRPSPVRRRRAAVGMPSSTFAEPLTGA
jgi:hypothetical protein